MIKQTIFDCFTVILIVENRLFGNNLLCSCVVLVVGLL